MLQVRFAFALLVALSPISQIFAQEKLESDPRKPVAIETAEVPPVPEEIFTTMARYQGVRSATFQGWSPEGSGILISTRFANSAQLHRVRTPGATREQVTFFEEPVTGSFLPSPYLPSILASSSRGGNENFQLYHINLDQYKTTLLTDGKSRNTAVAVNRSGDIVAYTSNRRNGSDMDIYVMNPVDPNSSRLLYETTRESWNPQDISLDGRYLLIAKYVSINEGYLALLDMSDGSKKELGLPGGNKGGIGAAKFSHDGKRIYVVSESDSEFHRLYEYDLSTQKYTVLSGDVKWNVDEIATDERSDRLVYAVNKNGFSELYLIDNRKTQKIELPLGIVAGLEFSPDGKSLGFTFSQPNVPSEAYSYDFSSRELVRWTFSEVSGLDPASFVSPEAIEFTSFDGLKVPAFCYRPKSASPTNKVPVVISIHGGPESQYRPTFSGTFQYYVNEAEFAVIAPNVRGSDGYGKTYLTLDNAEKREDSVKDIGALLDWIATQPDLDASRVAVTGGSYGGYMVLASLCHYGDKIRAGVDIVGIANFITFLENTAPYRRDLRRAEYGNESEPMMRAVFEKMNPSSNADKIVSALMVAHGKNDPRVPFSEAVQIANIVRKKGKPVWTVYANNEGHGFAKKDNAEYVRSVEALFLESNLKK